MPKLLQAGLLLLAAVLTALAFATWLAHRRWRKETTRLVARLESISGAPARSGPPGAADLPAPVARYLSFALGPEPAPVRGARLIQEGEFFLRPGSGASRFTAVDRVTTNPPGLIWDADIRIAPLVGVRVRDSYVAGTGTMHAALEGLLTLAHETGSAEVSSASLQRLLAEAPWVPTMLRPGPALTWAPVDDSTARATLTVHGVTASVDFHFGPEGEITGMWAERYRSVDGRQVLTPWIGTFGDYERVAGMMVPRRGEIAWDLPEGRYTYWRGRIVAAEYIMAP